MRGWVAGGRLLVLRASSPTLAYNAKPLSGRSLSAASELHRESNTISPYLHIFTPSVDQLLRTLALIRALASIFLVQFLNHPSFVQTVRAARDLPPATSFH